MAAGTMDICEEGSYQAPSVREQIQRDIRGSVLYQHDHVFPRAKAEFRATEESLSHPIASL
jgi:hypothetical protein